MIRLLLLLFVLLSYVGSNGQTYVIDNGDTINRTLINGKKRDFGAISGLMATSNMKFSMKRAKRKDLKLATMMPKIALNIQTHTIKAH